LPATLRVGLNFERRTKIDHWAFLS
jgi:hypothetical protein